MILPIFFGLLRKTHRILIAIERTRLKPKMFSHELPIISICLLLVKNKKCLMIYTMNLNFLDLLEMRYKCSLNVTMVTVYNIFTTSLQRFTTSALVTTEIISVVTASKLSPLQPLTLLFFCLVVPTGPLVVPWCVLVTLPFRNWVHNCK